MHVCVLKFAFCQFYVHSNFQQVTLTTRKLALQFLLRVRQEIVCHSLQQELPSRIWANTTNWFTLPGAETSPGNNSRYKDVKQKPFEITNWLLYPSATWNIKKHKFSWFLRPSRQCSVTFEGFAQVAPGNTPSSKESEGQNAHFGTSSLLLWNGLLFNTESYWFLKKVM